MHDISMCDRTAGLPMAVPDYGADVAWAKPEFSKGEVTRQGRVLVDPSATRSDHARALLVVNNWRSSHSFPLNTITMTVRKVAV